ncbi:MAG: phosphotransferase, partial [Caulobacterales bacterium]
MGGFPKETILVDAETPSGAIENMVIRAEKHDRFVRFTASAIADEFAIVSLMHARRFPVAEPLWLEADQGRLARRFMVSRRVDGINTTDWLGNSMRFSPALLRSFMETLARLHNTCIDDAMRPTRLSDW